MVGATRIELAFTPWDVPPVVQQDVSSRNENLNARIYGRGYQDRTGDLTSPRRTRYRCAKPRINIWSGRPDLNWRPRSPEPRALPTAPRPDKIILS